MRNCQKRNPRKLNETNKLSLLNLNYMAGYIVNDVDKATSMGLDVF